VKIVTSFKALTHQERNRYVLTIGNFDGVHGGHEKLLRRVVSEAKKTSSLSAVLTFKDHPLNILHPDSSTQVLSTWAQKMSMLQALGVNTCFLIDFLEVRNLSPDDFFTKFLFRYLTIQKLILGFNFRFGFQRSGTLQNVEKIAATQGFEVESVEPVRVDDIIVSSTVIRRQIQDGNLQQAEKLLNHPFVLEAPIVKGSGRGATLGFPTANLALRNQITPPEGVWAVEVDVLDVCWNETSTCFDFQERILTRGVKGAFNLGRKPTFEMPSQALSAEVYLLDWKEDLVGKTVRVRFIKKIRDEIKFESSDFLKKQIQHDVQQIKNLV
jgi:riboflavin kinase/FMN adenylyltransferase